MAIQLHAPAKLNLTLHITGKRADGYHLLDSLVVFPKLYDVLTLEAADDLVFSVSGEFAAAAGSEDNLVLRAARALRAATGTSQGAKLALEKNIPVGAGLGGGSSDAAAALNGLNDLWRTGLDDAQLAAIGVTLGADVPMCLAATPLVARGIGDTMERLAQPLPPLTAVLVHPRIPLLTAQVYALYDGAFSSPAAPKGDVLTWLRDHTRNDLQRAAIAASPLVAEVLLAMETALPQPALVRMTGSGACCFALFTDADRAATYGAQLHAQYPQWWVKVAAI